MPLSPRCHSFHSMPAAPQNFFPLDWIFRQWFGLGHGSPFTLIPAPPQPQFRASSPWLSEALAVLTIKPASVFTHSQYLLPIRAHTPFTAKTEKSTSFNSSLYFTFYPLDIRRHLGFRQKTAFYRDISISPKTGHSNFTEEYLLQYRYNILQRNKGLSTTLFCKTWNRYSGKSPQTA